MSKSVSLERLLRIRQIEEEQHRLAMAAAVSELHTLETALDASLARQRHGRRLVGASALSGDLLDRHAGLIEARNAGGCARALQPWVASAGDRVAAVRVLWMGKRVERKQVETLRETAKKQAAIDTSRRSQEAIDQWFLLRRFQDDAGSVPPRAIGPAGKEGAATVEPL